MDSNLYQNMPDGSFQKYIKKIAAHPLLTKEEEMELAKRIEQKDQAARDKMIQSNMRLVLKIAGTFDKNSYLDFEDLVSEGTIGLMEAVDKFDYRRRYRFSTYAFCYIQGRILRVLGNNESILRVPKDTRETLSKIRKFEKEWEKEHPILPTPEEISKALNISLNVVLECQAIRESVLSLDEPADEEGDANRFDFLEDKDAESVDELLMKDDLHIALQKALETLSDKERYVIERRMGLNGYDEKTLDEIGKALKISYERVRQIEGAATKKLKKAMRPQR